MPDPSPIPVSVGFDWTAAGAWTAALTMVGTVITLIIRQIGPWRKQTTEAEQRLREELERRLDRVEKKLARREARHEAERSLDRHKIRNLIQCLDAVLFVLEKAPDKTVEVVAEIRVMRARQMETEAAEAAAIHAADLMAAREEEDET